jgi:hypothetical protein
MVSGGLSDLWWAVPMFVLSGLGRAQASTAESACEASRRVSGGRWVELHCELPPDVEPKGRSRSTWIHTGDPPAGPITMALDAAETAAAGHDGRR